MPCCGSGLKGHLIKRIWTRNKSGAPEINHPNLNAFQARQRTIHHDLAYTRGLLPYSSKKPNCRLARPSERVIKTRLIQHLFIKDGGSKHRLRFLPRKIDRAMVAPVQLQELTLERSRLYVPMPRKIWVSVRGPLSTLRFKEAIAAYCEALLELRRDKVPLDWAMTQNNLGNAFSALGEWEADTDKANACTIMKRARGHYAAALEVWEKNGNYNARIAQTNIEEIDGAIASLCGGTAAP
jgi:tetratricopeptide (TPR) repeat protein